MSSSTTALPACEPAQALTRSDPSVTTSDIAFIDPTAMSSLMNPGRRGSHDDSHTNKSYCRICSSDYSLDGNEKFQALQVSQSADDMFVSVIFL